MKNIIGVDEAGRGAWAGPLVVGAARLKNPRSQFLHDLRDSKVLSLSQREKLYELIICDFVTATGWAWPGDIDKHGLAVASSAATFEAVEKIATAPYPIIIDGNINYLKNTVYSDRTETLIKGDSHIVEIMAAAIVAKVERDRYMQKASLVFAGYGFEKHVGYGTKHHRESLLRLGISELHRRSYKPIAGLL